MLVEKSSLCFYLFLFIHYFIKLLAQYELHTVGVHSISWLDRFREFCDNCP